jgi:hypothetical protein
LVSDRTDVVLERPFHIVVVLWGKRFREYFLDYCVPSLLAPGNLPALRTRRPSKVVVATLPEDWEAMRAAPIFRLLEQYVTPVFVEIPPCPPNKSGCEHMGEGHKLCLEAAFREQAYAMVLTPDCMLSDGTIARLQELAAKGTQLVLAAALRFGEEPFFENLRRAGALPTEPRREAGQPLAISGAQMAGAAVNGFHSETLGYAWESRYAPPAFPGGIPAAWWRVPGEDGIVLHSLSWAPLLMDYAEVRQHDLSTLDGWTLDGDYTFDNFGSSDAIHIVTDSDEAFIASWGRMSESAVPFDYRPMFGELSRGAMFRNGFYSSIFNPLKRRIFHDTVRWHGKPLNGNWTEVEARALRTLGKYIERTGTAPRGAFWRAVFSSIVVLEYYRRGGPLHVIAYWLTHHHKKVLLALRGDPAARRWALWALKRFGALVVRHPFREPRPEVPGG